MNEISLDFAGSCYENWHKTLGVFYFLPRHILKLSLLDSWFVKVIDDNLQNITRTKSKWDWVKFHWNSVLLTEENSSKGQLSKVYIFSMVRCDSFLTNFHPLISVELYKGNNLWLKKIVEIALRGMGCQRQRAMIISKILWHIPL